MLRLSVLIAFMAVANAASAAESKLVTLSKEACSRLVQHAPADGVNYKPGVDVRGKPVVPADLGGSPAITMPEEISIWIGVDVADRLTLREARRAAGATPTPGLPGTPTPAAPIRKVLPFEGRAGLGELTIKGSDAFWNGSRIAPQDELQLAEACRQSLDPMNAPPPKP